MARHHVGQTDTDGLDYDPAEAIKTAANALARDLGRSDWVDGCPVTTTALGNAIQAPDIRRAAADAFTRRRSLVAAREAGFADADADLGPGRRPWPKARAWISDPRAFAQYRRRSP